MKINQEGLTLLKQLEGCKLKSYQDRGGVWTIGYGHTGPDVRPKMIISQDVADDLLTVDLSKFEAGVDSLVKVPLTENQFSALVIFSYNVGLGALQNSTLLKKVNLEDFRGAAEQFSRWNKVNGKDDLGLTKRRKSESDLFSFYGA